MTTFNVPEMSCGHCKAAIEKAIAAIDAAAKVVVDLTDRTVSITSTQPDATLIAALSESGYEAMVKA